MARCRKRRWISESSGIKAWRENMVTRMAPPYAAERCARAPRAAATRAVFLLRAVRMRARHLALRIARAQVLRLLFFFFYAPHAPPCCWLQRHGIGRWTFAPALAACYRVYRQLRILRGGVHRVPRRACGRWRKRLQPGANETTLLWRRAIIAAAPRRQRQRGAHGGHARGGRSARQHRTSQAGGGRQHFRRQTSGGGGLGGDQAAGEDIAVNTISGDAWRVAFRCVLPAAAAAAAARRACRSLFAAHASGRLYPLLPCAASRGIRLSTTLLGIDGGQYLGS